MMPGACVGMMGLCVAVMELCVVKVKYAAKSASLKEAAFTPPLKNRAERSRGGLKTRVGRASTYF